MIAVVDCHLPLQVHCCLLCALNVINRSIQQCCRAGSAQLAAVTAAGPADSATTAAGYLSAARQWYSATLGATTATANSYHSSAQQQPPVPVHVLLPKSVMPPGGFMRLLLGSQESPQRQQPTTTAAAGRPSGEAWQNIDMSEVYRFAYEQEYARGRRAAEATTAAVSTRPASACAAAAFLHRSWARHHASTSSFRPTAGQQW